MELRHLRYFVAVAEELNFSRAARRLRMAQPPLSAAIRQLEQEVGTSLFARTSREVKLTEAGEAFISGARRALAEADAAVVSARRTAEGELGTLRIAYSWSARFETLPALGAAFAQRFPDVELIAEEMWNSQMTAALRSGSVDLAVAVCPEVVGELAYMRVRSEPIVALLSSEHELAALETIPLDALADERFLIFPRELAPRLFDFFVSECRSAGFEPRHSRESFHTRWTLRRWDGDMVALVPQSVARELPEGVVAVTITGPPNPLETHVVWREDDRRAKVTAFGEVAGRRFDVEPAAATPNR